MEKINKLYKIMLSYLNSCLEFTILQESFLNLPLLFEKIKQKLESETDIIKFIYLIEFGSIKSYMKESNLSKLNLKSKKKIYIIVFI